MGLGGGFEFWVALGGGFEFCVGLGGVVEFCVGLRLAIRMVSRVFWWEFVGIFYAAAPCTLFSCSAKATCGPLWKRPGEHTLCSFYRLVVIWVCLRNYVIIRLVNVMP